MIAIEKSISMPSLVVNTNNKSHIDNLQTKNPINHLLSKLNITDIALKHLTICANESIDYFSKHFSIQNTQKYHFKLNTNSNSDSHLNPFKNNVQNSRGNNNSHFHQTINSIFPLFTTEIQKHYSNIATQLKQSQKCAFDIESIKQCLFTKFVKNCKECYISTDGHHQLVLLPDSMSNSDLLKSGNRFESIFNKLLHSQGMMPAITIPKFNINNITNKQNTLPSSSSSASASDNQLLQSLSIPPPVVSINRTRSDTPSAQQKHNNVNNNVNNLNHPNLNHYPSTLHCQHINTCYTANKPPQIQSIPYQPITGTKIRASILNQTPFVHSIHSHSHNNNINNHCLSRPPYLNQQPINNNNVLPPQQHTNHNMTHHLNLQTTPPQLPPIYASHQQSHNHHKSQLIQPPTQTLLNTANRVPPIIKTSTSNQHHYHQHYHPYNSSSARITYTYNNYNNHNNHHYHHPLATNSKPNVFRSRPGQWINANHHHRHQNNGNGDYQVVLKDYIDDVKSMKYGEARLSEMSHSTLSNQEYKKITGRFLKLTTLSGLDLEIVKLYKIRNDKLLDDYKYRKESIKRGLDNDSTKLNEKCLYHGTNLDVIPKIITQGFLRQFTTRHAFGQGCYFAVNPAYSTHPRYATPNQQGIQFVFVCSVVCGEFCKGNSMMKVPDIKPGTNNILYETTVNDVQNPTIFVTFNDCQAIPRYLIAFKNKKLH